MSKKYIYIVVHRWQLMLPFFIILNTVSQAQIVSRENRQVEVISSMFDSVIIWNSIPSTIVDYFSSNPEKKYLCIGSRQFNDSLVQLEQLQILNELIKHTNTNETVLLLIDEPWLGYYWNALQEEAMNYRSLLHDHNRWFMDSLLLMSDRINVDAHYYGIGAENEYVKEINHRLDNICDSCQECYSVIKSFLVNILNNNSFNKYKRSRLKSASKELKAILQSINGGDDIETVGRHTDAIIYCLENVISGRLIRKSYMRNGYYSYRTLNHASYQKVRNVVTMIDKMNAYNKIIVISNNYEIIPRKLPPAMIQLGNKYNSFMMNLMRCYGGSRDNLVSIGGIYFDNPAELYIVDNNSVSDVFTPRSMHSLEKYLLNKCPEGCFVRTDRINGKYELSVILGRRNLSGYWSKIYDGFIFFPSIGPPR